MVGNLEIEIGLTHNIIGLAGMRGEEPFDSPYPNIRGIMALYPSQFQFIIDPDLGITSLADIRDGQLALRIGVGDPGSAGELAFSRVLKAYGMTYEDIEAWGGQILYKDMSESASMFGDNQLEAFAIQTLAPAGPIQQAATGRRPAAMLNVSEAMIQSVGNDFGYIRYVLPAGTYTFTPDEVVTFASYVILMASEERPEQEIYQVTRSLIENLDFIHSVHTAMSKLTTEEMTLTTVPLHPGAIRAYQEAGIAIMQ